MADEKPYDEAYFTEFRRLCDEQNKAAQDFAAQTLLLRIGHMGASKATRERLAEEAAQKWIAAHNAIDQLNAVEYAKTQAQP